MREKKNRVFLILTLLIFLSIFSFNIKATDYKETFDSTEDFVKVIEDFEDQYWNTTYQMPLSTYFEGDLGIWYMGRTDNLITTGRGYQVTSFFDSPNKQLFNTMEAYEGAILHNLGGYLTTSDDNTIDIKINGTGATGTMQIFFMNGTGQCVGAVSNSGVWATQESNLCGGVLLNEKICPYDDFGTDNTLITWNISTDCELPENITFSSIAVAYFNSNNDIRLEEISFNNFGEISQNQLPTCTFNLSQSMLCYTNQTKNIYNIDCTDQEGDTIYYATSVFDYIRINRLYREDFMNDDGNADYKFFDSDNFVSNYTEGLLNDFASTNICRFIIGEGCYRYFPYITHEIDDFRHNHYLRVHDEVKDFAINIGNPYKYDIEIFNEYMIVFNDTKFYTDYVDGNGDSIFNLTYNLLSNGNLTVYYDGVLIGEKPFDNRNIFTVYANVNVTTATIDIDINQYNYLGTVDNFQITHQSTKNITNFVGIKYSQKNYSTKRQYIINLFTVEGANYKSSPQWSTTVPITPVFNNTIDQKIELYVTDNIHLSDSYRTYKETVYLSSDELYCGNEESLGSADDIDKNPLVAIKRFITKLLDDFGFREEMEDYFWLAYVIVVISIFIATTNIGISFTLGSIGMFIVSWLFGLTTEFLIMSGVVGFWFAYKMWLSNG